MNNKKWLWLLPLFGIVLFFTACRAINKPVTFYVFSDTHCMDSMNRYEVLEWSEGRVGVSTDRVGGVGSTGRS